MKISDFKKVIKESIREVFQEELKEILLEAVKSNKGTISEHVKKPNNYIDDIKHNMNTSLANKYKQEMDSDFTFSTGDLPQFRPENIDPVNGVLPAAGVDLSQIMNLL
jgi:hypothetical protein